MKFRTSLALIFCGVVTTIIGFSGILVTRSYLDRVTLEFGNKLSSIAAAAAVAIDGEQHGRLAASGSKGDESYNQIRMHLLRIKKAAAGQGVYDLYTLARTDKPNLLKFVVEVDESGTAAGFLEEFDTSPYSEMQKAFNGPAADKKVTKDKFGYWLSAYAPIIDRDGQTVAIIGVDASAESIHQLRNKIIINVLLLLVAGVLVSVPISWLVSGIIEGPVRGLVQATQEVGQGNLDYRAAVPTIREFKILAESFNHMVEGLKERNFIKSTFSRYVSREVVDKIIGVPEYEVIKGERRNVTVLFTDLRQFTPLAETMRAEDVLDLLNEHFTLLIDVLFEYDGTLDKFTGDGLMAMFGNPVMHTNDPERAVRAALDMQERMRQFNVLREEQGLPPLRIGIGINSGTVVAGGIGSNRRMEYTAIGDTVNVAARIQDLAEGGQVLIAQTTYEHVKDMIHATPKGPVALKGKKEPLNLFIVDGIC